MPFPHNLAEGGGGERAGVWIGTINMQAWLISSVHRTLRAHGFSCLISGA